MLTKEDASAIIAVVKNCSVCRYRIHSYIDDVMPDSWGISGSLRNMGYVFGQRDPSEPRIVNRVCVGISEGTMAAVRRGIKADTGTKKPGPSLQNIKGADTISRVRYGMDHTATLILLKDKSDAVFDWHATLNIENPLIYPSGVKWMSNKGGVVFESFKGFEG